MSLFRQCRFIFQFLRNKSYTKRIFLRERMSYGLDRKVPEPLSRSSYLRCSKNICATISTHSYDLPKFKFMLLDECELLPHGCHQQSLYHYENSSTIAQCVRIAWPCGNNETLCISISLTTVVLQSIAVPSIKLTKLFDFIYYSNKTIYYTFKNKIS